MLRQHDQGPELAGVLCWQWRELRKGHGASTVAVLNDYEVLRLDAQGVHPAAV